MAPVRYSYLDEDAWTAVTNDGPHASLALTLLTDNLEVVKDERRQTAAAHVVSGFTRRVCSPWPAVFDVHWHYLPEPTSEIRVLLRLSSVEWSVGMAAPEGPEPDHAISFYATTALPGVLDRPPAQLTDWVAPGGARVARTAAAQTVELFADAKGRAGWVAVLLWSSSTLDTVRECYANASGTSASGGIEITFVSPPGATTNPWERACALQPDDAAQRGLDFDEVRGIGYLSQEPERGKFIYPVPPIETSDVSLTGADNIDFYGMGVGVVSGVYYETVPTVLSRPKRELFFNGEPLSQGPHGGLASETLRLGRNLTMHHGGAPVDLARGMPWLVRSPYRGYPTEIDGTWRAVAAAPVFENNTPAADKSGLRAFVSLAFTRARLSTGDVGPFNFRLAAYTPGGALQAAGPETGTLEVPLQRRYHAGYGAWNPIAQTIWGTVLWDQWQFRGQLLSAAAPNIDVWGHDWLRLFHLEVTIPETELVYPLVLKVEAQRLLPSASEPTVVSTVAATVQRLELL